MGNLTIWDRKNLTMEERKRALLKHYQTRNPVTFFQLDGFVNVDGDCVMRPDADGDWLSAGLTDELMTGAYAVRILITKGTSAKDALRLIRKLAKRAKDNPKLLIEETYLPDYSSGKFSFV